MPPTNRFDDPLRALAIALVGVVVVLLAWEQVVGPLPGEDALLHRFYDPTYHPSAWQEALNFFQAAGTPLTGAATALVLAALVAHRLGPRVGAFVLVASAGVLVAMLMQELVGPTHGNAEIVENAQPNFPSGHVVFAVTTYGAAAWALWGRARDVALVLWGLVALMGPTRVFDAAHIYSDVLAGYAFGFAWLIAAHRLVVGPPLRTPAPRYSARLPALRAAASRARRRSGAGTRDRTPR